SPAEAGFFL
nr:Chain B, pCPB9 [synthetic construct]